MSTPIRRTALLSALACLGVVLFVVSRAPGSDSSSSSNPPMLSVCISPAGDYHCGLTTSDIKIRASTCGMPGPAESDWSVASVLGLVSHDAPVYVGSWSYEWTFANGLHPATGTVTISGAFSFAGGWANRVEEYELVTLTDVTVADENDPSRRVFATDETIRFKATSTPAYGPLRCDSHGAVQWQYGYWTDPQQTEPTSWTNLDPNTAVSPDKRYAYLRPSLNPGFYMVQARLCPASDWHRSPKVTVPEITGIQVCRHGSGIALGSSAIIAAGAKTAPAHKADVKFTIAPVPSGTFSVSIPVSVTGGGGYASSPVHATLGSASLPGNGTVPVSFTQSNTNASGEQTVELTSSNKVEDCTLSKSSASVTVSFSWDRDETGSYDFEYPEYFIPDVPDTVRYYPTLHANAGEGALAGHNIPFYTCSATIISWTYDFATDALSEETEAVPTYSTYSGIPFGQSITTLVQHTATSSTTAGEYSNSQTVQDYYDIVGTEFRVIEVQSYWFGVYDLDVY